MGAWVTVSATLQQHPKYRLLSVKLGHPEPRSLIGALALLWSAVRMSNPDGDIADWSDEMIAAASHWPLEEAERWAGALRAHGWIDGDGKVHDWMEHSGRNVREAARVAAWRERRRTAEETALQGHNGNGTVRERTRTNVDATVEQEQEQEQDKERSPHPTSCTAAMHSQRVSPAARLEFGDGEAVIELPTNGKSKSVTIRRSWVTERAGLYPAVDVEQELREMRGWLLDNAKARKTANGVPRFVNGWLGRAQDRPATRNGQQQSAQEKRDVLKAWAAKEDA